MPTSPADRTWPFQGRELAWGTADNLLVTAVPLLPADLKAPLRRWDYLERLCRRLEWMIQTADDPGEAAAELAQALRQAAAWDGQMEFPDRPERAATLLTVENPMFGDLFNIQAQLPMEPYRVSHKPAAVRAIKDATMGDWLELAIINPVNSLE